MRKRNCRVEVCYTKDELENLIERVKKTNFSLSEFIRNVSLGVPIKEAPPAEYYDLIRELRRVGW